MGKKIKRLVLCVIEEMKHNEVLSIAFIDLYIVIHSF